MKLVKILVVIFILTQFSLMGIPAKKAEPKKEQPKKEQPWEPELELALERVLVR